MLHQLIKENTHKAHQQAEGIIVRRLKNIRSNQDYAEILKHFYAYFKAVELTVAPYITESVLPDIAERRNSSYIKKDIESLGYWTEELPQVPAPDVTNVVEALASLYVLEGSIMGGPYIVKMLNNYGIVDGTSFFEGYGENSAQMWTIFTNTLNEYGKDVDTHAKAVDIATETFHKFGAVFNTAQPVE